MFVLDKGTRFVVPRTEMTYPAHNLKLHQNAADPVKSPVDHVMADFEDACPYEFKGEKSRKVMVEALNTLNFGAKVVTVRPNNIHSPFFQGDMEAIVLGAPDRFHGIILPKTRGPEEIRDVSDLLDDLAHTEVGGEVGDAEDESAHPIGGSRDLISMDQGLRRLDE